MIASRRLAPLPLLLIALAVLGALLLTPEVQAQSRDSGSDFTLDATNGYPTGIWSDETTMWVADFADGKLYAYRMSDRSRDSGRDFTLDTANGSPVGIWSDGTTMWASDFADGKLYAYRMSDRSRDSGKDFNTLSAAGNKFPEGIWSDGTTMWVADNGRDMLFAYNAATMARDADKDFTLDLENDLPVGIWSDGYTMWVVDWRDAKLYAYSMSDRSRDAGKDFALDADDQSTEGLWSVGSTMWVASRDDDKLYAYDWNNPATGAPTITGAVRVDETLTADITGIADADGLTNVSYSYRWIRSDGTTDTDIAGETNSTYTLVTAEQGRTIKVRVSFTDDANNQETLTSEATAAVEETCPRDGPAPVAVTVTAVPIAVESTTDEYFVLYARQSPGADTTWEIPVSVTLGSSGTTTLTENVAALPLDHYRVEKYLVADPADVDVDCIDDITELADPVTMNPVNPAAAIDPAAGGVIIADRQAFESLSFKGDHRSIDRRLVGLEAVKFYLIGMKTDRPAVYFMNTKTYHRHRAFESAIALGSNPLYKQGVVAGEIAYHPSAVAPDGSLGVYRYQLKSRDQSFEAIAYAYTLLAASMPLLDDNLAHYPMWADTRRIYNTERALYDDSRVNVLLPEDVFWELDFIYLNTGDAFGFLRTMTLDERPNPRDIVIYETLPNELPHVAGIITTVPQTPLSHVNLRAIQDGVPNAFIRRALEDTNIGDLDDVSKLVGRYVHYIVFQNWYTIRPVSPAEVDEHYASSRPPQAQTPERDLSFRSVTPLSDVDFEDWRAFGVKAANVAVLGSLDLPENTVPDGFAVPFYFYDEFMKHNGFYEDIDQMLANPGFQSSYDTQDSQLKKLRKKIKDGDTPGWITQALEEMHAAFPQGTSLRYRSSTNNEDLPGFSGAGLYDSKTQHPNETVEDGISKSLKQVYASLWNFRAFTEREFHRIDHRAAAMGVLVHPNFSDELANGVAVSFDPIRNRYDSHYVNTQVGEDLVTNPEAHSVPEEILLQEGGGHAVLATSNQLPVGQLIMSDDQMTQLRSHLEMIHERFADLYCISSGEQFAMEIEFKITSDNILSIKQARPWVFSASAGSEPTPAISNTPAQCAPVIMGVAQVGQPLTVSTSSIRDADGMTSASFGYQWVSNDATSDTDIVGATDSTYTLSADDEGKTIKVRVSFADDATNQETLTSTATTAVTRPNSPATGAPTISGTARVGETLTADITGIADEDGLNNVSYSYQWIRNGGGTDADIAGETASTYTLSADDEGKTIKVEVSFTDDAANQETLTSAETTTVTRPNSPATGAPTISGTAQAGETLTADISGIADEDGLTTPVFTYQWVAGGADISGATSSSQTLTASQQGQTIQVRVSFTDDAGNQESLTSEATAAAAPRSVEIVEDEAAPLWSADMLVVEYTSVSIGAASTDLFSNVGGSAGLQIKSLWHHKPGHELSLAFTEGVSGAEDLTLQVGDLALAFPAGSSGNSSFKWKDVDVDWEDSQTISVRIVPTSATITVPPNTPATGAPVITGTAQVDETLTADISGIADEDGLDDVSYNYQWIRSDNGADADIAGETDSTYTLVLADQGKTIKVKVSFTDDDDNEESLTSVATVAVASAPNREATGQPTIDGTPQVRETLTADTANIADQDGLTGVSYRYQWIAGGSDIDGATSSTYILTASEHGQTIQVKVSFTDDRNNAETLTSAATVAVAAKPNTAATGEPTISGTAQVGETLTADTSGIDDADGLTSVSYRYQWIAGGSDISGATGSSRLLTASQQGQTVQVKVTFTDDADNQESLTSAETLAVAARPNTSATGEPAISGTPQVEATLTADTSAISDEDGLANVSYQYQWLRDDADIAGQTNSTYRLVSADQGKTIRVRVAFADDRGNEETITSEPTTTVAPSNPQPEVVPRLQEWAGGSGNFALSASSRIVVSAGDGSKHFSDDFFSTVLAGRTDPEQSGLGETQRSAARLALADSLNATAYHTASRRTLDQVAAKIRDDIEDLTGLSLAVITASASISPQAGDVVVDVLDASSYTVAAEGYELAIGDWATIRANSTSGVFYGSRTLLQILAQSGNNTVPRGTARDYPTLGHRLIHLDMNRKYWEMDYLADSFRRMSWVKLNAFKIHFADANGWRLHDPGTAAWSGTMPAAPTPDTATEVLGSVSLGAPTGVKVLPGAGSLTVQWDPPNDQTDQDVRSYRVQIRRQGDLAWSPADYRDSAGTGTAYLTMTDRSHNFGGLTDGVTYEVRVSADTGFPGLADSKEQYQSGDKKWFYDREDIRLLEAWAAENHISIMPGFEFPGHTSVINNLYETGFADGGSDRCGNAHVYGNVKPGFVLDTTSSRAVAQAKTIMEHFMPWFSGPYVHIGGEEVSPKLANCPRVAAHIRASSSVSSLGDMLTVFFNDLNQLVREMDKSMIIYNGVEHLGPDTNVAQLDSTVVVMDWNAGSYNYYGGAPGSTGARHKFMKMRASDGYYLTSNNFHALYPEESRLYDKWVVEPAETYLGAAIGVWLDYIYWSQDEYTELLLQRPRAILGDRTWNGSATPDTVDEFYARVQAIGEPPAYQGFTKRTRVNDGLPSHHYGFEDDTEVFPPTHFKNLRHGRIHLLRDEAGELHATSYNITSPSVRDDDKKFGASSWEFSKGGHGAGIGGVDIPAPWTMSIWVKRTADRVGAALMSSRSPTGDHRYIRLQRSGTQVGIDDRNGLGCSFDYSTPLNEWTHLAFVADTATITLYVDGVPQSATCASMPLPMGAISARGNDSLRAYLDELKIWDETLSRAQVERLAVSEAASLPGPLTGFTVVNASDQTTVEQLAEGATLTLDDPASGSYDIRVDTESGAQIGSVRLELSGRKTVSRTENITPYSLHGDGGDGGDGVLHGEPLPAGSYTLRATAYEEQDLGGDVLGTLEVSFTLAAANTPATGALTIGGTAQAGATLTADTSGIADADGLTNAVFSYQWIANDGNGDTDIVDATDPTYELSDDDIGQTIRVRVSFTDDGNTRESLTSAATGAVGDHINSLPTGAPVIIGTTEQGETLTADTSGITDIDGLTNAAFSYQWIRNGDTDGDTDIIDATDPTYELTSADLGRTIKVRVSFTDDAGNSESLTSAGTDEVGEAKLDPCSGGGYYPVPVDVAVAAVPIVVDSTTEEYFVLYVRPDLDSDREIPVSVTLGQNGTTTLTEQLSALPREHYRVEKYLIADPSDVDGDCIDDIGELQDPVGLNPLNPAPAIPSRNGAVAIPDHETFEALSYKGKSVSTDIHLTDLEYVKFYLLGRDTDRPSVYFVNTVRHRAHIDFGNAIDLWEAPIWRPRWAMAGAIIYHPNVIAPDGSLGVYRYEFRPLNSYSFDSVAYSYEVLAASMPLLDNNLAYYPMPARASPLYREEKALYDDSRINVLFEEDILPDVDFIPLNLGEGYGFLRVMSLEERPNPRDIVIYETLPNELSRVAGIITTVPQTPLSHVNLRAVQDGVPNAFIRDALDDADIEDLVGGYVHYTVEESGYSIRAATRAEVDAHYAASSPSQAHSPERDLTVTQITALSDIEFEDWTAFGVKAANVAVLGALYFPEGTVPDGFAVPFYFYDEFMKHNEFYDDIEKMLADSDFQSDFDTQESELKKLRKRIKKGETPEWINTALTEMHAEFPAGTSLRYRSSTNNEDLPGFSGAGLYDSKTQHPEETEEDGISKSLKQVYASLWNFRAFTEREFHRIDHLAMAMGVLVHPNYSDELANGVAVSFDPVSGGDESYYVNTQVEEDLVTNPDAYSVPEEILLHQGGDYTVLATSNQVQRGQLLMSDAQMDQLRRHLEVIHDEFEVLYGVEADEPFAMEIEFKITSDDILSIKQARPWVFEAAPSENNPATGAPSIRGTAQVDQTLTADTSGIADADGLVNVSFSYQWIRNDGTTETDIENATSSTYTLSDTDVGETIKVRVSFTDDRGYEETLTSAATTAITGPNTPATGSPTISGTAQVDETLTADVSGVTDADGLDNVSYTYQWIANDGTTDTDIENATAATYTPVIDDQGKTIKVRVSFTDDANNSETLSSEATATVATASQWRADMSVVDYGTGAIGAASADLFSNVGGNAGLQAKWLWYYSPERKLRLAFTERVPGTEELTLQVGDVALALQPGDATYSWEDVDIDWEDGQTLTARIVGARANAVVAPNSPATGAPTINGTAQVGETLTADTSGIVDADGLTNVSYSYQWIRNDGTTDTDIQGATSSTYTLVSADEGKTIKVRVSFTDDAGHSETLTSGTTNAVAARANSPATGLATISGTAQVGEVLAADTPGIVDADGLTSVSYSYQWIRNDGNTDADIGGQTASTYTLVTTDQGKTIKVKVSFTDDQGNEETLTSAATAEVAAKPNSAPTGLPTINGTAQVGETLSADTSAIADEDGLTNPTYRYQWIRGDNGTDANIAGQTDSTYTLVAADQGKTIKVQVSFTDRGGYQETLTSTTTIAVAARTSSDIIIVDVPGTVSLWPELPRVGTVVRAALIDPDGLEGAGSGAAASLGAVSWQWARSSEGSTWTSVDVYADGDSYTPTEDDEGMWLKVTAMYTDGHGEGKSAEAITAATVGAREASPELTVTELVTGLTHPWDIAFTPDGTMLFTERDDGLRVRLTDGTVRQVTADFSDLNFGGTAGLLALVLDPDFVSNRRFYTYQRHTGAEMQLIAWTIDADYTTVTRVADPLVGGIPRNRNRGPSHGGGRLRFGPQGYLWVATGDGYSGTAAQDLSSLGGKVLRVDSQTGAGAPDNPFAPSPVYTYGHRNPQGLALRPGTSQMWSVEHGPNHDDEINLLVSGGNYGWDPAPDEGAEDLYDETTTPMTDLVKFPDGLEAKWSSGYPTLAVGGGVFLEGSQWREWEGQFAVATLKTRSVRVFKFTEEGDLVSQVVVPELDRTYGRLRTAVLGPDGALYITTTNGGGKDKILKVVPANTPATGAPSISGTAQVDETLTADASGIADADGLDNVSYTYQWIRNDGNTDTDIQNATSTTYMVSDDDAGKTIRVRVSFTDDRGNTETLTSAAMIAVQPRPNTPATGIPTISGTAQVGETLTVDTSGIADEDGLDNVSYSYQWIANDGTTGTDIEDATDSAYTPPVSDVGKAIKVRVTFTDDADNEETLTSTATDTVAATKPGAPGHLNVFPHDTGALDVYWEAPASDGGSAITGYKVQWKETTDSWDTAADVSEATVTGTTQTITGLTDGMEYTARVKAVNDVGEGPTSAEVSGTPEEAQIWSATLTVGIVAETFAGYTTFLPDSTVLGALSSDTITLDDASYTVKALGVLNGKLILSVMPKLTADFVLVVGTDEFASTDASTLEGDSIIQFQWNDRGLDLPEGEEVAVRLAAPDDGTPATGLPVITGTARVGQTLTADTSGIADADGLTNPTFTYQWTRTDGTTDTDITGETSSTHTVTEEDAGNHLKVSVTFTDDLENIESLTSTTTKAVGDYDTDEDRLIEITTLQQLHAVRHDLDGNGIPTDDGMASYAEAFPASADQMGCPGTEGCMGYELMADLDFDTNGSADADSADAYWNDGAGWTPIGGDGSRTSYDLDTMVNPFLAIFEGNGHSLSNLFINRLNPFTGMFGYIGSDSESGAVAVIRNLNLVDINVTGNHYTGGLVAVSRGVITHTQVDGLVAGGDFVGGLVGQNDGVIADSHLTGCVSGDGMVGGVVGRSYGAITNSSLTGCVSGTDYVGGLVGNNYGPISASHTEGQVSGNTVVGGLVGSHKGTITASRSSARVLATGSAPVPQITGGLVGDNRGAITVSYATGDVSGKGWVGGLVGQSDSGWESNSAITASYATGRVSGTTKVGGLVGTNRGAIAASYARGEVSGNDKVGGMSGSNDGTITASYWDTTVSGQSSGNDGEGKTTEELQTPTGYSDIYGPWNLESNDIAGSPWDLGSATQHLALAAGLDTDNDHVLDYPWDLGSSSQYPALAADLNGDGRATWQEFGHQLRAVPVLNATVPTGQESFELTWTPVDTSHWSLVPRLTYTLYRDDGDTVEAIAEQLEGLKHTDNDVTSGEAYAYQVVATISGGETAHSAWVSATLETNTPAAGAPTISGTAQVGETLTAETSGISDADGLDDVSYSYQWIAGGSGIDGVAGSSHTLTTSEQGQAVQVRVSFTDDAGNPESLTSEATAAVGARPNTPATGAPTISGTARVDQTLTADTSGIADEDGLDNATFTYQWLADDANIDGATDSRYTLTSSDEGKAIKVKVSFTDDANNEETLTSAATAAVAPQSDNTVTDEEAPVWSADMLVVEYTSVSIGAASADLFSNEGGSAGLQVKSLWSYKPDRDLRLKFQEAVPGAADLTLQVGDLALVFPAGSSGHSSFTWTDVDVDWEGGQTLSVRIVPTSAVAPQPNSPATGAPTISGTAQVDQTLTAGTSVITDQDGLTGVSYRYQWIAGGADISGATGASYTLTAAEEGQTIQVQVTFTDDADYVESLTSAATVAVAAAPNREATGAPTISGTPQVGETLTADTATIADQDGLTGVSYIYQWIRNDGTNDADIGGQTGSTYTLTDEDVGKTIKVRVSFTDDADNAETRTSEATDTVAATKPGVPGHLNAFPHDAGALDVYWEAPASDGGSDITGYKVQWKASADSWDTAADVSEATASGTIHTITGLTDGVEYSVRVLATNGVGDSPPSVEQTGTPRETKAPEMVRPRVDGATLKVLYDEALDEGSAPPTDSFDVRVACTCDDTTWLDEEAKRAVESVSVDGDTVVLTLVSAATSEDVVVVSYTPPSGAATARTRDLAGNAAAGFISTEVFNDTDETAESEKNGEPEETTEGETPLTVSLEATTESHNGTDAFTFEIRFSEEFPLSYKTLRDLAFTMSGGEVLKAQRLDKPSNIRWLITVEPDSNGDVTVVLPVTTDCDADGAVCTADGRKLSTRLEFTVSGPGQ